ncbi:Transcriptional regulator, MarR family [Methanosarcina siciliae T4/M]|nr:Transcriptional regulator, MarR family [Methanosarcina siciliae T4/M]
MLERTMLFNKLFERDISQKISRARFEELEKLGKQQPTVILIIGMIGEIIPSYLGLCMNLDRSSLSRMIDSMETKGIVKRRIDPGDRRKVLVSLTEKGARYHEILLGIMEEVHASIMDFLDEQDLREYEACLKTEVRIMKKIDSKLGGEE